MARQQIGKLTFDWQSRLPHGACTFTLKVQGVNPTHELSSRPDTVSSAGKQAHDAPDEGLLALLARYYNEVADLKPQLDLIPLLPFASWSLGQHGWP